MQRKNIKHFAAGICLLFTSLFYCLSANADVLEGTSGQTLSGEYAVIINTDTSASQETGTLVFDDDDSTSLILLLQPLPIPTHSHRLLPATAYLQIILRHLLPTQIPLFPHKRLL